MLYRFSKSKILYRILVQTFFLLNYFALFIQLFRHPCFLSLFRQMNSDSVCYNKLTMCFHLQFTLQRLSPTDHLCFYHRIFLTKIKYAFFYYRNIFIEHCFTWRTVAVYCVVALYSWQTQFVVGVVYKHEDSYKQTDRRAGGAAASSNLTPHQRSVNSTLLSHHFCLLSHSHSSRGFVGFPGWFSDSQRQLHS